MLPGQPPPPPPTRRRLDAHGHPQQAERRFVLLGLEVGRRHLAEIFGDPLACGAVLAVSWIGRLQRLGRRAPHAHHHGIPPGVQPACRQLVHAVFVGGGAGRLGCARDRVAADRRIQPARIVEQQANASPMPDRGVAARDRKQRCHAGAFDLASRGSRGSIVAANSAQRACNRERSSLSTAASIATAAPWSARIAASASPASWARWAAAKRAVKPSRGACAAAAPAIPRPMAHTQAKIFMSSSTSVARGRTPSCHKIASGHARGRSGRSRRQWCSRRCCR